MKNECIERELTKGESGREESESNTKSPRVMHEHSDWRDFSVSVH